MLVKSVKSVQNANRKARAHKHMPAWLAPTAGPVHARLLWPPAACSALPGPQCALYIRGAAATACWVASHPCHLVVTDWLTI
jgi:hypothetical protein